MFCFNCGNKIMDGAKFCPNCGTNLSGMMAGNVSQPVSEKQPEPQAAKMEVASQEISGTAEDEDNGMTAEEFIEAVFRDVFKGRRQFGDQVYIIGKDPITQEIKENLQEYYLSGEPGEKALLAFDYGKNLEEGFVITNRRLVWYFGSAGQQEILLPEIRDVMIGKVVLATVMNVVDFDNVKYKNIYLTGIRNDAEFVLKFRRFIDILKSVFHEEEIEQNTEEEMDDRGSVNASQSASTPSSVRNAIIKACNCVNLTTDECEVGNPVLSVSAKKYTKAKTYFRIPDNEEIYLIYDATVFGSCQKGFAICSNGLYYSEDRIGYIGWEDFKSLNISKGITGLKIGDLLFSTGLDGKKLMMILKSLQEYL